MVQQNLVNYIISQMRQGRSLEDINKFLEQSGYNKSEVESSVEYVVNTQMNPELAEQQRIQQLTQYIQQQINVGYDTHTISTFLTSRGYPYYEVNSAVQQATLPKKEVKLQHNLVVFALIAMFVMTAAVTVMYFNAYTLVGVGVPDKLLDVETERLTTIIQQGGELNFKVKLINFGYEKRFDVELVYSIIDRETQGKVLEKKETLALSTTLENIVTFEIPETMKSGNYVLRVDAVYGDFTATSGFIFDLISKDVAEERLEEIKQMIPEDDVVDIPELASEPILEEDKEDITESAIEEVTEPESTKIPQKHSDKPFYEGKTKQQAFEMVKATAVREPQKAVEMCKTLRLSQHAKECIKTISEFKKDGTYCRFLEEKDQDLCFFELAIEIQQYGLCKEIGDANIKQSCDLMSKTSQIQNSPDSTKATQAQQALESFRLEVEALNQTQN
ncbi:hypothetical protein HQ545_07350 [Candidatus Woesearchaeota archaeon]|nr:hypothetical protein [Candidatus Woesearchaeota archaeon]